MKLRLPSKLVAAILAAASPVLYTTLSTATIGTGAALVLGAPAKAAEDPAPVNVGDTTKTMHVYILTGQSNAQGAVYASPASPSQLEQYDSAAIMWNASLNNYSSNPVFAADNATWRDVAPQLPIWGGNYSMGGEYGFASMMERLAADENVTKTGGERLEIGQLAVIKASLNGGGNQYWQKGNAAYEKMLEGMKNALQTAVDNGYESISIDGLMYLQGESNDATGAAATETRYKEYISNLTTDLSAWVTEQGLDGKISVAFDGNTVLGEPSRDPAGTIAKQIATATDASTGKINTDGNGIGFVYARDLAKGADNLHYTGESQLTIGARYAYALAVQQGYNVGAVRGSDSTKSLDNAGAWWMEQLPDSNAVVKWDVSSVAKTNTISSSLTVGGIVVEDPYQGQVNISGGTLHVGAQGITLEQGSLNVSSAFVADADQTWKVAGGRTLNLSNGGTVSNNISVINSSESGTANVSVNGATQHWDITGDVALKVASANSITMADQASLGLTSYSGSALELNTLIMGDGTTLSVGGADTAGALTIGTLTLGGDAAINLDFLGTTRYDKLTLTNVSGSGTVNFNFNVTKVGRGGTFTVVQGWHGGEYTYSGLDGLEGASFGRDEHGNLVLTLGGSDTPVVSDYTKPWPTAPATAEITGTEVYSAYDGTHSNVLVNSRTSTGNLYAFAVGSTVNNSVVGGEDNKVDIYAELHDVSSDWVAVAGSNSTNTKLATLWGNASLKVSSDTTARAAGETFTTTAYSAVNATTVNGNLYMELDNPNATYVSVNGTYQSSINGSNTIVIKSGTVNGTVVAGSVNGGNRITSGTYLQIEGGTFSANVAAGNSTDGAVIDNGAHLVISGGTFSGNVAGGNNGKGTINGGVDMLISGGTFNGYVYGGNLWGNGASDTNSIINGDINMEISGGTFNKLNNSGGVTSVYAVGYGYKVDGNVTLTLSGGTFADGYNVYTGGWNGASVTAGHKTTLVMQDIDATNPLHTATINLYGSGATTKDLVFSHVTTDLAASFNGFTSLSVRDDSDATIKRSKSTALTSSVSVQEGSTLSLENDGSNVWNLTGNNFDLEEGATLKKTGTRWTNIGTLTGEGTYEIAGASGYGSQVGSLSGFSGTIHVTADNSLQMTVAGSTNTTFNVDKGGTASLKASADKMGTLSGAGEVTFRDGTLTVSDSNHTTFDFDNWTGIVKLTDANLNGGSKLNLSKLGCKGSTIQLAGVGTTKNIYLDYYQSADTTNAVSADINLTGSGLQINGGYSGKTTIFEGAWTGDGNLNINHAATQTIQFLGNMTDYAGNISLGGAQTLEFGNGDVSVNLGIAATSDTGKGTITGAGSSSSTAQVKINYLTDSTSSSTMTGNLALTQNGSQVLTVLGHNNYTGATNINHGSIKLEENGTLGTGTITVAAAESSSLILDGMTVSSVNTTNNATISGQSEYGVSASGILGTAEQKVTISNAALSVNGTTTLGNVTLNNSNLSIQEGGHATISGESTTNGAIDNSGLLTVTDKLTLTGGKSITMNLGQLSGAGTIEANSTNGGRVYNISGDLSGWTGAFEQSAGSGSMTLNINNTDVLNADITNKATANNCTLALNLQQGMTVNGVLSYDNAKPLNVTLAGDTVFTNTANINTLTATDKTVTLGSNGEGATATHGNLTLGAVSDIATLVINDGATATATAHNQGTGFIKGSVNVNAGGTLNLSNADVLGWGGNSTTAITMEGTADKLATTIVGGKQTFNTTLTLNGNTLVKNADSDAENKGLEIFQDGGRTGSITASGTNNTIETDLFLRSTGTITTNANAELTISGNLKTINGGNYSSTGSFTKAGAGTLILSGNNTYTGTTTVNAGKIVFNGGASSIGAINMANGNDDKTVQFSKKEGAVSEYSFTTMNLASNDNGTKWLIVDKGVTVNATGNNIGNNANASINTGWNVQNGGLNINGILKAAGAISLDGPGTAYIKGAGTIQTAGLNISNGRTVNIQGGLTIDITSSEVGIYKRAGADSTLKLADVTLQAKTVDWELKDNINTVNLTDATTGTTFEAQTDRTITITKAMGGSGALNKTGAGILALNAGNTFSGNVTVDEGTLKVGNATALGDMAATQGESPTRTIKVNNGGALDVNGNAGTGVGYAVILNGGTLTNTGSQVRWGNPQLVTALTLEDDSTVDAKVMFGIVGADYASTTLNLGSHTLTTTGVDGENGTFIMVNTTISGSGKLLVGSNSTLDIYDEGDKHGSLQSNIEMNSGKVQGTVNLGADVSIKNMAEGSAFTAVVNTEGRTLTLGGTNALTLSNKINGTGKVVKTDANTITLSAANTYTGGTEVQAGTLVVSDGSSSTLANSMSIARLAELQLTMGAGTYTISGTVSGEGDMTFSSLNGNRTYNFTGDLSGLTGNLRQLSGSGSMTLNITNTPVLNANIYNEAGTNCYMNVNVEQDMVFNGDILRKGAGKLNIAAVAQATLHGAVTADNLTINVGKSATFNAAAGKAQTIVTLSGSGALTVSGTAATETAAATGGLLRITDEVTNDGDAFTGSVTLSNTQAADAVGLLVQATGQRGGAICHSVVHFESGDEWDNTTYTSSLLAFRDAGGNAIDGTVAGLSGNRGHVIAKTLTINVAAGEEYAFLHRYEGDTTHDSAVLEIGKLVKGGAGTQIIGGEYHGDDGLVIRGGVSVREGTLHMKTRGTVTTDFEIAAGATLLTTDDGANRTLAADAVQYKGSVTMVLPMGSVPAATLNFTDGSTYISGGLDVQYAGHVINSKGKNQFINGLNASFGAANLTFTRTGGEEGTAIDVLTAAGSFSGTVHLESEVANGLGLQVLGESAKDALANTVVDFAGENTTVLSFRNDTEASTDWAESKMDGSVAGLTGTNGAVYADNLTIHTADEANHDFGGALNVTNIVKDGAGTQNISGNVNSFNGKIDVNNGTLAFTGLSANEATENINNLHVGEGKASVSGSGALVAGKATFTANGAAAAMTADEGPAPATHTGTIANAVFTDNSLSGTNGKGSLSDGLLAIQEAATYSINEMTLINSVVDAETAVLNMQNVSIDATSGVVAGTVNDVKSTLAGSNRLTLSAGEGIKNGLTVESSQLTGLTLTNGSNLTLDLSAHGYAASAKIGDTFYIELSGFSWEDLAGKTAGKVYEGSKDINEVFKVLALGTTDTYFKVLSVTQGVSDGNGGFATGITLNVEVPEPTTSVLSLLALAGMAARRKRK